MLKKQKFIILLCLFSVIAFVLRFYLIPENLFFGPEQGIDMLAIKNIAVNRNLTLIGAKTDISGVFHGPFLYYISVIPFLFSGGNPLWIIAFFIGINSLTIFSLYFLCSQMFSRRVGMISAAIYTVSYSVIVYARWLSGPPLSIPLSVLFFLTLVLFLKGHKLSLLGTALFFGLLGQAEFLNYIYFSIILLAIVVYYRKQFFAQNKYYLLLLSFLLVFFSTFNYILFDFRHDFLISKSLYRLVTGGSGYYTAIISSVTQAGSVFSAVFAATVLPGFVYPALAILVTGVYITLWEIRNKKNYGIIILIWLLIPVGVLVFLRHDILEHFFAAVIPAVIILSAVVIDRLWQVNKYAGIGLLCLILIVSVYSWLQNIPRNRNMFFQSTQPDLKYSDQLKVIDRIYEDVGEQPFSFQSYTIPYWLQQGWEYLFWFYGEKRYGHAPLTEKAKVLYVIVQRDDSNRLYQSNWLEHTVAKWGNKRNEFTYGVLTVHKLVIE